MSYQTNLTTAQATGEAIQAVSNKVNEGVNSMKQYAAQHLNEWTGSAQTTYYDVERQWTQAQMEMGEALQRAQVALAEIHRLIEEAERSGTARWQGTPVGHR